MQIRIDTIETRIQSYRLRPDRTVISPAGRHDESRYLIVRASDADGVNGFGEAATTPLWSGESADTAQWMVDQLFAPALVGQVFDHPRDALHVIEACGVGNWFAKSAVDTAIWDLWGRVQGKPVSSLIADRDPVAFVPVRASIGTYPVEETVRIARELWDFGIRTLKFKVGNPGIDDPGRLRAVRDALGGDVVFTVDANGGYPTVKAAVAGIEALMPSDVRIVEQPTPRERIHLLAQVRREIDLPILADECIFSARQLDEALDLDAFDMLSVYPGKNGGFTHAVDMARTAQKAGKPCAVGSNLESDLGLAAKSTLAASLTAFPVDDIACDLSAALYYESSSVTDPPAFEAGRIQAPTGPGFGAVPLGWVE